MTSKTPNPLSRIARNRIAVVAAALVVLALVGTLGVVALTPQHDLPVGTAVASGDSMGADSAQFVIYADIGASIGDVVVFDPGPQYDFTRHRIVGQDAHGFLTKGDANAVVDQHAELGSMAYATDSTIRGVQIVAVPIPILELVGLGSLLALLAGLLAITRPDPRPTVKQFSERVASGKQTRLAIGFSLSWWSFL